MQARTIRLSPFPSVKLPVVSLPRFLQSQIEKHPPNKAAYIDGKTGNVLTFAQMSESTQRLQQCLYHNYGVRKGDTVAIFAANSLDYPVIMNAFIALGATVTQGSPRSTESEMRWHLLDSGAKFVVIDGDAVPRLPRLSQVERVFSSTFNEADANSLEFMLANAAAYAQKPIPKIDFDPQEDVVFLPYSSGTTGTPKGIELTHYNLVSHLQQTDKNIINPMLATADIINLALLPFNFIYGTMLLNHTLYSGQTSVILDTFYLKSVLRALSDFGVNFAGLTPPILHSLATNPLVDKYSLKLKHVGTGGGALNKFIADKVESRLNCTVSQGYGMTEASPAIAQPGSAPIKHLSVGFPLPCTELRFYDKEAGCDVDQPNKWGSMLVKGPQIMKGYHNDKKATQEAISEDGWLSTGDVGFFDEDGYIYVVDREKDVIRYKGSVAVSPSELERIIQQHPAVADVVVVPSYNSNQEEIPKAFLVLADDEWIDAYKAPREILDFLNAQVAPHKQIHHFEILSVLPRNHVGKVMRRDLALKEKQRAGLISE